MDERTPVDLIEDLFRRSYLRLVRVAGLLVDDISLAEDVVQEVFSGLTPSIVLGIEHDGYLVKAVVNRARTAIRREQRSATRQHRFTDPVMGHAPSAEDQTLGETSDRMMEAIQSLPQRQREVIVMRYYLDLSASESADRLGITPTAVRSSTHRALAALGLHLEGVDR